MDRIKHISTFSGGLDYDTHPKYIKEGDYLYALNMRNTNYNDGGNGAMTNVKGNTLIPFNLPAGNNRCVGVLKDEDMANIIYWVHNDNGNHKILKYDTVSNSITEILGTDKLKLNLGWRINQASLIDGRYLKFTDATESGSNIVGNPIRYVDIKRADLNGKYCKFDIIVNNDTCNAGTTTYSMYVNTPTQNLLETIPVQGVAIPDDKKDLYTRLAAGINASPVLSQIVKADACGGHRLEITLLEPGDTWVTLGSSSEGFYTLPQNRYHRNLDEDSITLGRRPPLCQPSVAPVIDASYERNDIQDRFFQFAVRYVYFDSQKSTLSPFSAVASKPLDCDQRESPYNAIDIDFTDVILNTENLLADVKYIEICAREGNSGGFKSVKKIERWELTQPRQVYRFKNDGSYSAISDEEAYRPHEYLPLLAIGENTVDDRGYYANTLEGYDNIDCVDAKVKVSYQQQTECKTETVKIRGKIKIQNLNRLETSNTIRGNEHIFLNQPIWTKNHTDFYFGGFNDIVKKKSIADEAQCGSARQQIPLGGFLVYLAGTYYNAISKQNPWFSHIEANSDQNVFDISDDDWGVDLIDGVTDNNTYSIFEIEGVPKGGKYILRFASNLVAPDNRNGAVHNYYNGIEWQRTSTYLFKYGTQEITELEIDTNTAVGGVVDLTAKEFFIMDLTNGNDETNSGFVGCAGYVIDGVDNWSGDVESIAAGSSIEMCKMTFGGDRIDNIVRSPLNKTDHNGFFFRSLGTRGVLHPRNADIKFQTYNKTVRDKGTGVYRGMLQDALEGGSLSGDTSVQGDWKAVPFFIVYNRNQEVTNCHRATVEVEVKKNNSDEEGVAGVTIISSHTGRVAVTDNRGRAYLKIYSQSGQPTSTRYEYLYAFSKDTCCPKIANNRISYSAAIACNKLTFGFYYFNGVVAANPLNAWKHRNKVRLGVQYYDRLLARKSRVQTDDGLETYIPFWTERGADKGLPIVSWEIKHKPPVWADHYQIVRILNPLYSKYLQYLTNEVRYVKSYGLVYDPDSPDANMPSVTDTSFEAGDATEIYISLQSLIDYKDENSGSILTWEFQPGDRVTLMKDAKGNWLGNYFDYRVENDRIETVNDMTYLVIKNDRRLPKLERGVMLEVYHPQSSTSEDIFYECGECYPILNPGTDQRLHGAGHNGVDQTDTTAATGEMKYGDMYYLSRTMPLLSYDTAEYPNPPPINDKVYKSGSFESEYMRENIVESKVFSIGRFDIQDKDFRQIRFNQRIRISGRYIPDTGINQLNTFRPDDYLKDNLESEIDRAFGGVMALVRAGNVLLAVCKNRCVPIYINATQVYDLNNEETLTRSSRIANLGQPIKETRGTQHPESIVVHNGEVYAYDAEKKVVWRYEYSGIVDISDYGAIRYFNEVPNAPGMYFPTGFDPQYEEFVFTDWAMVKTIAFNNNYKVDTRKNRWFTTYSWFPEKYGSVGNTFVSFLQGRLWLHNSNPNRGEFYGVQQPCGVDIVVNKYPDTKKIFWCTRLKSNALFYCPPANIETHHAGDGDNVQYSRLSPQHFKQLEGDWYADLLRNEVDPRFGAIQDENERRVTALLRGEVLRGDYMIMRYRNNESKPVILYSISVDSSVSMNTK